MRRCRVKFLFFLLLLQLSTPLPPAPSSLDGDREGVKPRARDNANFPRGEARSWHSGPGAHSLLPADARWKAGPQPRPSAGFEVPAAPARPPAAPVRSAAPRRPPAGVRPSTAACRRLAAGLRLGRRSSAVPHFAPGRWTAPVPSCPVPSRGSRGVRGRPDGVRQLRKKVFKSPPHAPPAPEAAKPLLPRGPEAPPPRGAAGPLTHAFPQAPQGCGAAAAGDGAVRHLRSPAGTHQ